jgi:DNA-binding XRE family transcriptional regulator
MIRSKYIEAFSKTNLQQFEFCSVAGISQPTIIRAKKGGYISSRNARKIIAALGNRDYALNDIFLPVIDTKD